ncbi:(2Fe-2S)-binding protein [Streptomyces sp. ISL-100]|nr:(2Fe-2S)-binding protein [Streptomyces sp. ISL-100]
MTDFGGYGDYGDPLAAPGHDYVPPQIAPHVTPQIPQTPSSAAATDPGATGTWTMPASAPGEMRWPEPESPQAPAPAHDPGATGQWSFESAPEPTPPVASELTGQWTIPVADGDLPDESGEFTTSALASHWANTHPPATLPGGAAAPWANTAEASPTLPGGASAPWAPQPPQTPHPANLDPTQTSDPERTQTPHPERTPSPHLTHDFEPHPPQPIAPEPKQPAPQDATDAASQSTVAGGDVPGRSPQGVERNEPEEIAVPERSTPEETPRGGTDPDASGTGPGDGTEPAPGTSPEPGALGSAPDVQGTDSDAPGTGHDALGADPDAVAGAPETPEDAHSEHPHASYVLRVNGADRPVTGAWIGESLLYVLRERLGLAGAKDGCSQGECGACAVQVDGRLVASCLVPAATTAGSEVRTVEGLATDGEPSDVQRALANCGAVQCGFCVPGMAMTVHDLLEGNHAPSDLETRQALCGNLCRCSGYRGVLEAVREVVAEREATAASEEARIPHQAPPGAGSVQQPHQHEHPHEHPHDGGMA